MRKCSSPKLRTCAKRKKIAHPVDNKKAPRAGGHALLLLWWLAWEGYDLLLAY